MLEINRRLSIPDAEIELHAIRAQGAGGQNVNKVSSAIHLRFNIRSSTIPAYIKQRLLALHDHRISKEGIIVIKAQTHRTQELNREEALSRLQRLIQSVCVLPKTRIATRPTKGAVRKRLEKKKQLANTKKLRGSIDLD